MQQTWPMDHSLPTPDLIKTFHFSIKSLTAQREGVTIAKTCSDGHGGCGTRAKPPGSQSLAPSSPRNQCKPQTAQSMEGARHSACSRHLVSKTRALSQSFRDPISKTLPLSPSCSLEIFFRSMKWVASATSFMLPSSHTWIFTLRHKGGNISLKTTCSCHTGSAQLFFTVVRP